MSAVQGLLERQARLNAAVAEQLRELKRSGVMIKGVKAPTRIKAEILQQLLGDLKQVNAAIKAGFEARKRQQDSHCCLRLKSSNYCGKNQERRWTLNVLKIQGATILLGGGFVGINLVIKSACEENTGLVTAAIGLTAIAIAGIANLVMRYDQRQFQAAENAAAKAIEKVYPPEKVNYKVSIFLCALENFEANTNYKTLRQCLKAWLSIPLRQRKQLPEYAQLLGELLYCLPEDDECKQLMNELYRLVAARSQGKTRLISSVDISETVEITPLEVIHGDLPAPLPEDEVKEKAEDLLIEVDINAELLTEYQNKWSKLEQLLGVNINTLEYDNVCYNKNGEWWLNEPAQEGEEKKVAANQAASGNNHVIDDDSSNTSRPPIPPLQFESSVYAPTPQNLSDAKVRSKTASKVPLHISPNPSPRPAISLILEFSRSPNSSNPSTSPRVVLKNVEEE